MSVYLLNRMTGPTSSSPPVLVPPVDLVLTCLTAESSSQVSPATLEKMNSEQQGSDEKDTSLLSKALLLFALPSPILPSLSLLCTSLYLSLLP